MNLLLDTHIILWWFADDAMLSETSRNTITDSANKIYVSAATAWEISIKKALGKLVAPNNFEQELLASGFLPLPITIAHAELAGSLPDHHHDPFDRMLIAQSKIENLTLLTNDKFLNAYATNVIMNQSNNRKSQTKK